MSRHSNLIPDNRLFVLTVLIVLVLAGNTNTIAQLNDNDVVKIEVLGPDKTGQAATGFLWKNGSQVQVVTSLHSVLHSIKEKHNIEVFCNGLSTFATVDKVLRKADLVLLKTTEPIKGECRVFTDSFEGMDAASLKPAHRAKLFTLGWKGTAPIATYRDLIKGKAAGKETLHGLVTNKKIRDAIIELKLPAMDLEIYLVKGDGLGGGYSGGPVVDQLGRLVGVVDGGMDKGATDYNWLVPATFLNDLAASSVNEVPKVNLELLDAHFSADFVRPAGTQTEIVFTPQPGQQQVGSQYNFGYSKTRWLKDIVATADPRIAHSIQEILQAHEAAVGTNAVNELQFDFFKDTDRNLIIAVPTGQGLVDGPLEDEPSVHMLQSDDINEKGFIQFEELVPDSEGYQVVKVANNGGEFFPEQNGFFDAFVEETMRVCRKEWDPDCRLDESSRWDTEFSGGNKVLTFGFQTKPTGDVVGVYYYYNVTVRDGDAFLAFAELPLWDDGNLIQCGSPGARCADNSTALLQLAQLVAANLTTFANE